MNSAVIEYTENGQTISLTVVRATGKIGMARSIMTFKAYEANKNEPDEALRVLRSSMYPSLIAPVIASSGQITVYDPAAEGGERVVDIGKWPISFEDFASLPDGLLVEWEAQVYRLNPHWNPAGEPAEDAEKKASS